MRPTKGNLFSHLHHPGTVEPDKLLASVVKEAGELGSEAAQCLQGNAKLADPRKDDWPAGASESLPEVHQQVDRCVQLV